MELGVLHANIKKDISPNFGEQLFLSLKFFRSFKVVALNGAIIIVLDATTNNLDVYKRIKKNQIKQLSS